MKTKVKKQSHDPEAKVRRCLLCGVEFLSSWAGNRVCKRCRQSAHWRQG